jgi:ribosomal protein L11 methyltransferase
MREVLLRVPRRAVEDVLDRLLPLVRGGVREVPAGREVELRMRGADVPALEQIAAAARRWPYELTEGVVSDDWRVRRAADYEPDVIGGRLVVRPEWAPPAPEGLIDIALAEGAAFGGGSHPTTRTCLELLLEIEPRGSFADLGCGTGVLAILAARLGWGPVVALDVQPGSVEAASENARRNGVAVEVAVADLAAEVPSAAGGFAANVPASLHPCLAAVAGASVALISGFDPDEAGSVIDAYSAGGWRERRRETAGGWVVSVLERGLPASER